MKKSDVVNHFGSETKVAEALEVTKQAVNGWGQYVPRGVAYEIQVITGGALVVDREVYRRIKQKRLAAA